MQSVTEFHIFCFIFADSKVKGHPSSAGLKQSLIGLSQDLVADLGVGDSPVFLPEVQP